MPMFRKKPVIIEAFQFTSVHGPFPRWLKSPLDDQQIFIEGDNPIMFIKTLEGLMSANLNDWIIKGVKDELYPCKPDIFDATYELA